MEQDWAGQSLGNYRLIRSLGSGGYATVYLGQHLTLKSQQAAVKVLKIQTSILSDKERDKFLREVNTIRRLSHPHIIRILECGIDGSIPYIVMQYAMGGNVRNTYGRGRPLPLDVIRSYMNQAADGLQHAHDHGVVHCDIKPENMLLGKLNEILLCDFGIADISHTADISQLEMESPLYTSMIEGTIGYMAPERFQGSIRRASDQYSLGIVAYEWLTSELPFTGSREHIMYQHVTATPPSIRAKRPEVSLEVENVVMKALAKEPEQRYASVKEFARALDQAIQAIQPVQVAPAPATPSISSAQTQPVPDPAPAPPRQGQTAQPGSSPSVSPPASAQNNGQVPPGPAAAGGASPSGQVASPPPAQPQAPAGSSPDPGPAQAAKGQQPAPPQPSPQGPPVPPFVLQPIVLQAGNPGFGAGQGQQSGTGGSQQPSSNRAQWYQNNAAPGNLFFADPSQQSSTIPIQPAPPDQGPLHEFTVLFTDPATALQRFFELDPEFARLIEFRGFRRSGMVLNILSVFAMGLLFRSWTVGFACMLAPVAFWLCIRFVKPILAGTLGILLAAYWGMVAWTVFTVVMRLPFFSTLPSPEIIGVVVFLISAVLHIRYVARRVP